MKGRQNLLGYKHTEETIDKLKELQTNKKHSVENLEKMRDIWAERKFNSIAAAAATNTNQALPLRSTKPLIETEDLVLPGSAATSRKKN